MKKLKPPRRVEYEITDLNKMYQKNKQCFNYNLSCTDIGMIWVKFQI